MTQTDHAGRSNAQAHAASDAAARRADATNHTPAALHARAPYRRARTGAESSLEAAPSRRRRGCAETRTSDARADSAATRRAEFGRSRDPCRRLERRHGDGCGTGRGRRRPRRHGDRHGRRRQRQRWGIERRALWRYLYFAGQSYVSPRRHGRARSARQNRFARRHGPSRALPVSVHLSRRSTETRSCIRTGFHQTAAFPCNSHHPAPMSKRCRPRSKSSSNTRIRKPARPRFPNAPTTKRRRREAKREVKKSCSLKSFLRSAVPRVSVRAAL